MDAVAKSSRSRFSEQSARTAVESLMRHSASALRLLRGTLASGSEEKYKPRKSAGSRNRLSGWLAKGLRWRLKERTSTLRHRPGPPRLVCQRWKREISAAWIALTASTEGS